MDASDRCDLCGSRAYVHVIISFQKPELFFCGHHYSKYEPALMESALMVSDHRAEILGQLDKPEK
jgi:hypothetical protein